MRREWAWEVGEQKEASAPEGREGRGEGVEESSGRWAGT